MNNRVAVIGGGGFLGSRFIEMIRGSSLEAVPIFRSFKGLARGSKYSERAVVVDTGNVATLAASFAGCDAVVNFSVGDWNTIESDTQKIWQAARDASIPLLIHISSAVVFGSVQSPAISDDSPPDVSSWMMYARSKAKAELFLRDKMGNGMNIVVLRPGLIWGPKSGWSTLPARQLSTDTVWLPLQGDGISNLIYIDNLVECVRSVLSSNQVVSGFFNVSDQETISWKRFYTDIASGLGYPFERIQYTNRGLNIFSIACIFEWLKQQPPFYAFMKYLLRNLSAENKSLLKYYMPWLAGGREGPPVPISVRLVSQPRFTRELYSLYATAYKLSNKKFYDNYSDCGHVKYEDALGRTIGWLKYSGYDAKY
jgi:nucleoside-diphosphate-sugar epimerase